MTLAKWLIAGGTILGVSWAIAWATVYSPVPSAEQTCASRAYTSDFCSALIAELRKVRGGQP